jgi:hypothetical protein
MMRQREGAVMMKIYFVFLSAFVLSFDASAGQTCSDLKSACDAAVASRGFTATPQCPGAYDVCMKTGVWKTTAMTVRGVDKR